MLKFAEPSLLLLLLPAALMPLYRRRAKVRPTLRVPAAGVFGGATGRVSPWIRFAPAVDALKYAALLLCIFALAGPQWGTEEVTIQSEGINIVLAMDVSESMAALDFAQKDEMLNRLEAVKGVARDFIGERRGDRIGLVVFGSEAYTQLPLTRDYDAIVQALDRIAIGSAGKSTAVGDALGISLKRLEDIESKSNVIILLTDGRSNAGEISPEAAARIAKDRNVKIYTIGVGGDKPAPFLVQTMLGNRVVYQQVDIDETTLKKIAEETGGLYFRATDTAGLKKIYDTIDSLEKNKVEMKTFAEYDNLYPYLVWPAFVLLLLWVLLTNTRYLRVP